jgi:flavin reductase (DIM6/NTAB) family NADH-FMN oxidoreductase RutF
MSLDPDLFRAVLGRFASGITVVTAAEDGRDHGMTVSAFASLSLDPPLILVCIAKNATMAPLMARAETFAVNILSGTQEALSRRFAGTADDRFASVEASRGPRGNALLAGALATLECGVFARHDAGDHTIVVGRVETAAAHDARPLLYYRGGYATLER